MRRTALILATLACLLGGAARAGDPDALWKIVDGQCEAHLRQDGNPLPCAELTADHALLKDRDGIAQFLLIPTTRLSGVESPELLAEDAPNYWAEAWAAKPLVDQRLPRPLARDEVSLAINSAYGRSQSQLHIHIDCLSPAIRDSLRRLRPQVTEQWAPLAEPLASHPYWARRIAGAALGAANPFKLLAEGLPEARQHMDRQTLVLTGAGDQDFILLADHATLAGLDPGHGEELQDHDCAIARR
jgi:CDP-diacylglycerol pyrophosphatase